MGSVTSNFRTESRSTLLSAQLDLVRKDLELLRSSVSTTQHTPSRSPASHVLSSLSPPRTDMADATRKAKAKTRQSAHCLVLSVTYTSIPLPRVPRPLPTTQDTIADIHFVYNVPRFPDSPSLIQLSRYLPRPRILCIYTPRLGLTEGEGLRLLSPFLSLCMSSSSREPVRPIEAIEPSTRQPLGESSRIHHLSLLRNFRCDRLNVSRPHSCPCLRSCVCSRLSQHMHTCTHILVRPLSNALAVFATADSTRHHSFQNRTHKGFLRIHVTVR